MSQKSYRTDENKLYLIPTPIGNMDDITLRSVKTLEMVDLLLCEDTRVTEQLLRHLNIKKKLISCHDHNEDQMKLYVISLLNEGKNIGLVTDRGTPIISDPGYKIVEEVIRSGFSVIGLPGATAFVPALIMSGMNPAPFLFYGFLNPKSSKRKTELELFQRSPYTLIFYEAPHRIQDTLEDIQFVLGNRKVALCREISKMYEEIYRGTVQEVLDEISDGIKGEIVLIVSGNTVKEDFSFFSLIDHVKLYVEDGMSEKDAIKLVAKERDLPKSVVYKEYHMGK